MSRKITKSDLETRRVEKRFLLLFLLFFSFSVSFFLTPKKTFALKIEPAKIEIDAAPRNIVSDVMKLTNDEPDTKTLYSSVELFEARGESGTPFFTNEKKGLSLWTNVPDSIVLNPGESKEVRYIISIPENAEPGGNFAAIFWSSTPPNPSKEDQVVLGAKLGMLVLLRVSGDVEEGGGIIEFTTSNSRKIFSGLPISFFYRFKNEGGDRIRPTGNIEIKNIFGKKITYIDANINQGNILPGSIRKFEINWNKKSKEPNLKENSIKVEKDKIGFFGNVKKQWSNSLIGPYYAELNLDYGTGNTETSDKITIFIFPWQLFLVIIAITTILWLGIKKYNAWLIKKITRQNQTRMQ